MISIVSSAKKEEEEEEEQKRERERESASLRIAFRDLRGSRGQLSLTESWQTYYGKRGEIITPQRVE